MVPIFSLFGAPPYVDLPQGWVGWGGVLTIIILLLFLLRKWRRFNSPVRKNKLALLILLFIGAPLANTLIGFQLPPGGALPLPGIPTEPTTPILMIFSDLPWMLAAGLLGPTFAAIIALIGGIFRALWDTHNFFTPLQYALVATLAGALLRQPYRTQIYRTLRHPLVTAVLLGLLFPVLHLTTILFITRGILVSRLDYALTNLQGNTLAAGGELLIAGILTEILSLVASSYWKSNLPLEPSPAEKSLHSRFLINMAPLALVLILTLMIGDWYIAGQAAREMLNDQMSSAAEMAAENVPYFLETGQSLITRLANDPRLASADQAGLVELLTQDIQTVPFFNQFTVLNSAGEVLVSYPTNYYIGSQAPIDEQVGIQLALSGVPFQTFSVQPAPGQSTAQVSFMAAILDQAKTVQGVLIGRSDLGNNPFTKPIISGLASTVGVGGQGMLLDENNLILVHPDPIQVMTGYTGQTGTEALSYLETAADGTRRLVWYQPAEGRPWAIVLMVPASRSQQIALAIATPLLAMILVLSVIAFALIRLGLRVVTASLQNLAAEADQLAQGKLDHPLPVVGEDEVGQLRRAFELMRASLKARLDELNRLLMVSQGVASSLEMSEAVQPILEAALGMGASVARVVLTPAILPDLEGDSAIPISFGQGPSQNLYRDLDEQILARTRNQDQLILSNTSRPRLLTFPPGTSRPESLAAVALRHEDQYYGTLWVAYDKPHVFSEEEIRFLVTLGSQSALAATNARLFLNTEIGRQRLAAILASSPDPVLVTDQHERLSLANPAAWQALGLGAETDQGKPIDQVIAQEELVEILRSSSAEKQSKEISLPDGRVYLATATPVLAEGQRVGRVCVLRDVTHFKELDTLKSDFVSTVSHDLRSPLTLMRGYATMLEMVGQLNEQQTGYVRKIIAGVESMARLVNNLLDLGRIEAGVGLQLEMIEVQDIVERVINALQLQAAQKRIQLTSELPAQSTLLIEADQALIQQALQNLVENAIKYTRPEGKVHMRVLAQPGGMVFEVIDNGIGISPMDQPRLFEKFYRGAQQGSKEQRGTGLGLAIVKSIVDRHGGKVWAESQLGKGSAFRMAIPQRQTKREKTS